MIIDVLILLNAERFTFNFKVVEINVDDAMSVFATTKMLIFLSDLNVDADIHLHHKHDHERVFKISDEKIFEIQFIRIKLKLKKEESL